jgi:hypothetical protein
VRIPLRLSSASRFAPVRIDKDKKHFVSRDTAPIRTWEASSW